MRKQQLQFPSLAAIEPLATSSLQLSPHYLLPLLAAPSLPVLPIIDWLGTVLFLLSQPIEICLCPSQHVVTKLGPDASGIYGSWWMTFQAMLLSLNEDSQSRQGPSQAVGGTLLVATPGRGD